VTLETDTIVICLKGEVIYPKCSRVMPEERGVLKRITLESGGKGGYLGNSLLFGR
jgi:hypothetical protein